jgi:hypothetical protein
MIKIYDDLFEASFLMDCHITALNIPWGYGNIANRTQYPFSGLSKGSHRFFGNCIYKKTGRFNVKNNTPDIFMEVLEYFTNSILKSNTLSLHQIDCNLQVMGQNGTTHTDTYIGNGKDRTILFYPHIEWKQQWGGELQIFDDLGNIKDLISPTPGRIVFMDSTVKHSALAPAVNDLARMSIAYRMSETL